MPDDPTTVDPPQPTDASAPDAVPDRVDDQQGRRHPGIALALISVAQLTVLVVATIVIIALPRLQGDLGFTDANLPWVVNAYALAFGGLLLLGGRMGDLLGHRKVFTFGVALLGVASFIGGIAQSGSMLLASRVLQGVGAAAVSPNALALISTTFPAGKPRNRAMAAYAAMSGAGPAVGLVLGGALTEASWRWTLFVNAPIGIAVAVLAVVFLGESTRQSGAFDLPGAVTSTVGLAALVYGLTSAADPKGGWDSPRTWVFIGAGLALILGFLVIEARSRHALLPARILADRTRAVSFVVTLTIAAAMFATFYFLGIYFQSIMGYSPLQTGLAFLPSGVGIIVSAQVASTLMPRVDPRWIAGAGAGLAAFGMWGYTNIRPDSTYVADVLPWILVQSIGLGLVLVPLTLTAVRGVAQEDSGVGSAVLNTMPQIGAAVGLATLTTVSTNVITAKAIELAPRIAKAAADGASPGQLTLLRSQLQAKATTHGFTTAFLVAGAMILAGAAVTLVGLAVKHEEIAEDGNAGTDVD